MKKIIFLIVLAAMVLIAPLSYASTYTEDFEAAFPTWESGWLGTNSNLQNHYGVGGGRGNNPDGLWIHDGNRTDRSSVIVFNSAFGATLTSFSIDIAGHTNASLIVYDMASNVILNTSITVTWGALTDPGTYAHYSVNSANGISGFTIAGAGVEGNTGIDNVVVTTGATSVPEPLSLLLLGFGLVGLAGVGRKIKN